MSDEIKRIMEGSYEYFSDRDKIEDKIENYFRKVRKDEIEDIKIHYGNMVLTDVDYLYRDSRYYIKGKNYRGRPVFKFETTNKKKIVKVGFDSKKHKYSHTLIIKFKNSKNDFIITGVRKDNKYYDKDLDFLWE